MKKEQLRKIISALPDEYDGAIVYAECLSGELNDSPYPISTISIDTNESEEGGPRIIFS